MKHKKPFYDILTFITKPTIYKLQVLFISHGFRMLFSVNVSPLASNEGCLGVVFCYFFNVSS